MALETATGSAECPECYAKVELKEVLKNEVVPCSSCGADLEVTALEPPALELAPEEEEDWGE